VARDRGNWRALEASTGVPHGPALLFSGLQRFFPVMRESLASHVPELLRRRLAARGVATAPSSEPLPGAVLLVDVAGFTLLTERFAQLGPEGAERMAALLDGHFARLTELVVEHGGDVQLFAGDAALALWPAEGRGLPEAAAAAARCADAIRASLHGSRPAGDVELRLRAGIGLGSLAFLELGGGDAGWLSLLAGDAIRQAGDASVAAEPGDVMLSPAAADALRGSSECGPSRAGYTPLLRAPGASAAPRVRSPDVPLPDDIVGPYLPRVVRTRFAAAHAEWLAEFRRVSVVFVELGAEGIDAAETLPATQRAVVALQRVIGHHGGSVYQLVMDDKGLTLVGAFGLPPEGAERAPGRAADAALAMHAELAALGLRASIGVASGRAFCGVYGSAARRQYTIVGSVINRAARLMQAARHDVLVDEATQRDAGRRVPFEPAGTRVLKGFAGEQQVFRPLARAAAPGTDAAPGSPPVFVAGRAADRALLRSRADATRGGHGGVAWVEGEAGIGKSHLLGDVASHAALNGVAVFTGAGDAVERATAFYAWRGLLAQLLGGTSSGDPQAMRVALAEALQGTTIPVERACFLNAILPLQIPETPQTEAIRGEGRADGVRDLVVAVVSAAAARAPTMLVVDDVHWIDSSSLELVSAVARRCPGVFVALGSRPLEEPAATTVRRLLETVPSVRVPLERLGDDELAALLAHRLGARTVPVELVSFIMQRTEGHPFHGEELALALRDAGLIDVTDGTCRLRSGPEGLARAEVPDSVQGVVAGRIDRLPPHEQLMLRTASVVGRAFRYDILHDVYPSPEDLPRLREGLADIERADLTRLESPDPDLAYLFKHVIVQDVAYESLPYAQRRALHRAVAERIERDPGTRLDALAPLLAHHWDVAQDPSRAIPHFERAGEQAMAGFAHREAIGFLVRARALAGEHALAFSSQRLASWESMLGEANIQLSDFGRAEQHLRNALTLGGCPVPGSTAGAFAASLWEAFRQALHRLVPPVPTTDPGERERLSRASHDVKRYAETVWFNNQQLGVVYGILRCLNLAEQSGGAAEMIDGYCSLGAVAGLFRLHGLGRWYFARAHLLAEGEAQITDLARVEIVFASAHADWERAHRAADYGCEVHGRQGARYLWEACRSASGYLFLLTGPLGESRRCFEEAHASARFGALQSRLAARAGQVAAGLTCTGRADPATVADYAEQLRYNTHRTEATLGEGLQAWAAARDGRFTDAEAHATRALALLREAPPNIYYSLWGIAGCCEAFLALWEARHPSRTADEWRRLASDAAFMMRRFAWMAPMAGPRAAFYRGCVAWLSHRRRRARRLWKAGLSLAERLRMPYDRALLELALGEHLPAGDPARPGHVDAAVARFAALGAVFDHARAMQVRSTTLPR
jgi:class 3 adenylate cyclase